MDASPSLKDHSACFSDCLVSYIKGNQSLNYDFSNLSQVGSLMSGPSFTSRGTKFFHFFNISLCGNEVSSAGVESWGGLTNLLPVLMLCGITLRQDEDSAIAELSLTPCKHFPLDLAQQCKMTFDQPSDFPEQRDSVLGISNAQKKTHKTTVAFSYFLCLQVIWVTKLTFLCCHQGTQVKGQSLSVANFFPYVSLMTWLDMSLSEEPLVTLLSASGQGTHC